MTRRAVFHDTGVYDDGAGTLSIQPGDSDLTAIAALTPTNDDVIQRKAGAWTNRSMAQLGGDLTATGIWVPYSVIDAKGDLLVGSANDALDNLSVGSDGKVLMADAASTLGVKWETPSGGGVTSINKTGSTALTGAVTLTGGTNVTLTQSGQDISIAATGGGSGSELDYVERSTDLLLTASSSGTAQTWLTGASVSYNGSTRVKIECFIPLVGAYPDDVVIELIEDSTSLGRIMQFSQASGNGLGSLFRTPSNASHTYILKAWRTTQNHTLFAASPFVPSWLRITTA